MPLVEKVRRELRARNKSKRREGGKAPSRTNNPNTWAKPSGSPRCPGGARKPLFSPARGSGERRSRPRCEAPAAQPAPLRSCCILFFSFAEPRLAPSPGRAGREPGPGSAGPPRAPQPPPAMCSAPSRRSRLPAASSVRCRRAEAPSRRGGSSRPCLCLGAIPLKGCCSRTAGPMPGLAPAGLEAAGCRRGRGHL